MIRVERLLWSLELGGVNGVLLLCRFEKCCRSLFSSPSLKNVRVVVLIIVII